MHDKNYNGSIDLDECVTLLYARFGKVRRVPPPSPRPSLYAPHHLTLASHLPPLASLLPPTSSPPASRLPPPRPPTSRLPPTTSLPPSSSRLSPPAVEALALAARVPAHCLPPPRAGRAPAPRLAVAGGGRQARARNVRPVRHREEHLLLQVRHRRAPPRPAAPRRHYCLAPAALECSLSWEAQHLDWRTHAHARTCTQRERERERERREGERGRRRALKAGRRWRGGRALLNSCRITPALCASFRFVAIQKRSSNLKDGKQSAAMVPQVKGLAYVTDPSMQHLL